jgi:uncharacterized protein YbjQ (UPF0145 family)
LKITLEGARLKHMIMTTGFIEHKEIMEYLDVVSANVVSGIGIGSDMMAAVKDFTGGRVGNYEGALDEARKNALSQVESNASKLGADAVMGLRLDVSVFSPHGKGTMIGITVYGTAVRLANRKEAAQATGRPFETIRRPCASVRDQQDEPERKRPVMGAGFEWGK